MSDEELIHNLNRINNNMNKLNERMNSIDIYIAKAEERESSQALCFKCMSDQSDKRESRLRAVEDRILENKPLIEGIGKWIAGIVTIATAMIIGYLFKGD